MSERLAELILALRVELAECVASGEHPAAALRAARAAYSAYPARDDDYWLLAGVVGALERAVRLNAVSPEWVHGVVLPAQVRRLAGLTAFATACVREMEEAA